MQIGPSVGIGHFIYKGDRIAGIREFEGRPNFRIGVDLASPISDQLEIDLNLYFSSSNFYEVLRNGNQNNGLLTEGLKTEMNQFSFEFIPTINYSLLRKDQYSLSIGTGLITTFIIHRDFLDILEPDIRQNSIFFKDFIFGQLLQFNNKIYLNKNTELWIRPFVGIYYSKVHEDTLFGVEEIKPLITGLTINYMFEI